ncbi:hypothetical protein TruAng_005047 [Truncatella angustata]|nr:hypothetical protein TruAng_005047 [Truncatella angustata]
MSSNRFSSRHSTSSWQSNWYRIFVLPDYRTSSPLGIRDPKEKAQLNKHFQPGFQHQHVIRSEPHMDEVMTTFFSWLDRHSADGTPMKMGEFFSYAAYDVTGEVTFSKSFGFTEKGEDIGGAVAVNEAMELFFVVLGYFRNWSLLLCNPLTTWLEILPLGYMGSTAKKVLAERRKTPDARFDIAAHWFRALDKVGDNDNTWNEDRIVAAAISNLGAGSDTVSCGMQHSDGWQRIREEIGVAQRNGECQDPIITYNDAAKLPYLQCALKEALRIFAPIPMGLPRVAPKGGVRFGDSFFPEGTILSVNPYVIQTSKALWGLDAGEFKPERWLAPDAGRLEKFFCPWGAGWSTCPGQHIARIQMSKMAATLVRDYDVKQVDPKEEWEWMAPHDRVDLEAIMSAITKHQHSWPEDVEAVITTTRIHPEGRPVHQKGTS